MRKSVYEGILKLGSLDIEVCILDDGTPIITEKSMIDFWKWLESGEMLSIQNTPEFKQQMEDLSKFIKK